MDVGLSNVACPQCGHTNPLGTGVCARCGTGFDVPTLIPGPTLGGTLPPVHRPPDEENPKLEPGSILSDRYQVIDILGVGGMGSVYKAFDRRLARVVALKTILPELAASPVMMKRFKQEVLLAQKITHKNVVRIFDIGEDQGTAFITMDFIEGESLKDAIQKRGKFPANEAVAILREVARALEAAHSEGVIHRDLKPQNIMIEKSGRIVVMDFGIARSAESGGATQTGALLGTPDYMSPEQARMEEVDARSDIFSLGLIFYELLTGKLAFSGKTIVETMFIRTKERAIPPAEIERTIPEGSNNIAVKCLEPDVAKRYQTVTDMLADLESFDPTKKVGASVLVKSRLRKIYPYRAWIAAAAAVLVLLIGGYVLRDGFAPAPVAQKANISVLIADFTNQTGEAIFDNALEPVIKLALEEASFISAFDRRTGGIELSADSERMDEVNAQKIAYSQGLGFVVSGAVEQKGSGYVISVKAIEAITGKTIHIDDESASGKDKVLYATAKLAADIRVALGDDRSQRFAQDTLSASSLEAVHAYATAMNFVSGGNHAEALKSFSKAVELDKDFGLAYAGMAVTSRNLRMPEEATKYMDLALKKIDHMTEREKLRTRAYSFSLSGNRKMCVEEYTTLIKRFPADVAAHNNLANCLTQMRDMKKAIDEVSQAMEILPKRPLYRNNLALYSSYASDFKTAEQRAREVQDLDKTYGTGFVSLAFAQLGQDRPDEAMQTYEKLQQVTGEASAVARNASRATAGIADVAIYSGRYNDAIRILQQGAAEDLKVGFREPAAMKLSALADTLLLKGRKSEAARAAERALEATQTTKIRFRAGMIFAAANQEARAREMIDELSAEAHPEPRAYAQILEGEIALRKGDVTTAEKKFTDANGLLDTWIGHFQLGKAYLQREAWLEADSQFSTCFRRRGESMALFLDESPTYGYFPLVHYYLGRAREGMKTDSFADSYRSYLAIRGDAGEDPLIAEVKKKTG